MKVFFGEELKKVLQTKGIKQNTRIKKRKSGYTISNVTASFPVVGATGFEPVTLCL